MITNKIEIGKLPKIFLLVSSIIILYFDFCNGIDFHKDNTGIVFTLPDQATNETVQKMLKTISSKFSKIVVYHNDGDSIASTAADLNCKGGSSTVELHMGFSLPLSDDQQSEIIGSINEANSKCNNTVKGVVVYQKSLSTSPTDMLETVQKFKTVAPTISIGTKLDCLNGFSFVNASTPVQEAFEHLDFIICNVEYSDHGKIIKLFEDITKEKFKIMIQTGIQAQSTNQEELKSLRDFWVSANDIAKANNVKVWMQEAFDSENTHFGWWDKSDKSTSDYIEKISLIKSNPSPNPSLPVNGGSRGKNGSATKNLCNIPIIIATIVLVGLIF